MATMEQTSANVAKGAKGAKPRVFKNFIAGEWVETRCFHRDTATVELL